VIRIDRVKIDSLKCRRAAPSYSVEKQARKVRKPFKNQSQIFSLQPRDLISDGKCKQGKEI